MCPASTRSAPILLRLDGSLDERLVERALRDEALADEILAELDGTVLDAGEGEVPFLEENARRVFPAEKPQLTRRAREVEHLHHRYRLKDAQITLEIRHCARPPLIWRPGDDQLGHYHPGKDQGKKRKQIRPEASLPFHLCRGEREDQYNGGRLQDANDFPRDGRFVNDGSDEQGKEKRAEPRLAYRTTRTAATHHGTRPRAKSAPKTPAVVRTSATGSIITPNCVSSRRRRAMYPSATSVIPLAAYRTTPATRCESAMTQTIGATMTNRRSVSLLAVLSTASAPCPPALTDAVHRRRR